MRTQKYCSGQANLNAALSALTALPQVPSHQRTQNCVPNLNTKHVLPLLTSPWDIATTETNLKEKFTATNWGQLCRNCGQHSWETGKIYISSKKWKSLFSDRRFIIIFQTAAKYIIEKVLACTSKAPTNSYSRNYQLLKPMLCDSQSSVWYFYYTSLGS